MSKASLPHDILYVIFLLLSPDRDLTTFTHDVYHHRLLAGLATAVSQVCRSWRATALDCPLLWSDTSFHGRSPFNRQALWIERSKDVPIAIAINYHYDPNETAQVIGLLQPHIARWRSLSIGTAITAKSYRLLFKGLCWERAPMLQALELSRSSDNQGWRLPPSDTTWPNVSDIHIISRRLNSDAAVYSCLKSLTISIHAGENYPCQITAPDLFTVLTRSSQTLEYFKVQEARAHRSLCLSTSGPRPTTISLPYLKVLSLEDHEGYSLEWASVIYSNIKAPSVEVHGFDLETLDSLVVGDEFPFPFLTSLRIDCMGWGLPQSTMVEILSQLPHLKTLRLQGVEDVEFQPLGWLCPHLRDFEVGNDSGGGYVVMAGVKSMVVARQRRAASLGMADTLQSIKLIRVDIPEEERVWLAGHLDQLLFN